MECIKCKMSEANKESGLCDACENEELSKINGLLYLPALGLILGVIGSTIELYSFTITAFNYFNETGFLSYLHTVTALNIQMGSYTPLT